ncbi:copper homeostasis protein CutC [Bacteroides sp. 224]|uniref:copper homeostasis protein CutC n=1 Tax=Bacteroides sp. 224 TaxID=2302936 RepID=UPI0013D2935B|nr:copper homeostasis protein CutC [Bacteroides sp. 224]NDV66008.1 copper homeostasis protein CutC [Bacteroides sp. 224]
MYLFEVCANSVESSIAAQEGGAHRVELCAGISEGGTTPSYGEIITARRLLSIKLHVIIRPRGGDFCYNELEAEIMERDIRFAKEAGVDGVVFGCLTPEGNIDIPLTQRLMKASEGLSVTFHRAFDDCANPMQALEEIIELGCNRILTSGQKPVAEEGIPLIKELVAKAGDRIIILPGSGISESNIKKIEMETKAKEFHFSVREQIGNRSVTTARRVINTIQAVEK